MSEVKGTLLAMVLAIGVFSIVFVFINKAINKSSKTVGDRIEETVFSEPDIDKLETSLAYHF